MGEAEEKLMKHISDARKPTKHGGKQCADAISS
jgi:hypothetical protein